MEVEVEVEGVCSSRGPSSRRLVTIFTRVRSARVLHAPSSVRFCSLFSAFAFFSPILSLSFSFSPLSSFTASSRASRITLPDSLFFFFFFFFFLVDRYRDMILIRLASSSRPSMISMIRSNRGDRRTRIIISLRQITWRRSRSSLRFPTLEKERGYVRGVIKHRHPAADQFRRRIDISPFERRKERRKKGRKEGRKEGIGTFRDDSRSILRKCITLGDKEEWRCRIVIGTFTDRRASVGRGAIGTLGIDV